MAENLDELFGDGEEDFLMSILESDNDEINLKSINPLEKMDIYQMNYIEDKHWYFKYRIEVLSELIKKYIKGDNLDILDIGVGTGTLSKLLDTLGNTIHMENDDEIIKFNNKVNPDLNIIKAGVPWNINLLKDQKFDYIVMLNLMEYVDNQKWIIDVLKASLKEDGKIIISTLSNASPIGANDTAYGIIKKFSLDELKDILIQESLKIDNYTFFENPSIYKKFSENTDKALKEDDLYWNYISKDNNITLEYYESKELKQVVKHGIKQGNQLFIVSSKMTQKDKEDYKKEQEKKKERKFIDKLIDSVVDSRDKKEKEKQEEINEYINQ